MQRRTKLIIAVALLIIPLLVFALRYPSNNREWRPELELLSYTKLEGELLQVYNLRNSTYQNETAFILQHYNHTYNISELQTIDFFVEPFSTFEGFAHTMLSFGFADGTHLVISIEARKEVGEEYTLTGGLTRRFELIYLFGDEQDVVLMRTNLRNHTVRMYPIKASTEQMRSLLLQMADQANILREKPEFYNTLTDTCTSRLVKDVNVVNPGAVPWSWKVLLPGYADSLAYDLGLINTTMSFEDAREHFRIEALAQSGGVENFSQRIRSAR